MDRQLNSERVFFDFGYGFLPCDAMRCVGFGFRMDDAYIHTCMMKWARAWFGFVWRLDWIEIVHTVWGC
jgi:hypothetical protein